MPLPRILGLVLLAAPVTAWKLAHACWADGKRVVKLVGFDAGEAHRIKEPAQVVAFIGPTASCKSLTQTALTTIFGNRSVDVMQVITGGTEFKGDWAEATHLMVEDKFSDNTKIVRERVKESVKSIAVDNEHRIHPKGKQTIQIRPFWRMPVSCNPKVGILAVLPPLDDSVRNKISLRWTSRFEMPVPAETADEKQKLRTKIEQELPALIHHLRAMGKAPQHLRDPERPVWRAGFSSYRGIETTPQPDTRGRGVGEYRH